MSALAASKVGRLLSSLLVFADKVVYTAVTAGCPTAFRFKYKSGGLAKMQVCSPLANMGNFSPSPENKAFRARTLLGGQVGLMGRLGMLFCSSLTGRTENVCKSVHLEAKKLCEAIRDLSFDTMSKSSRTISDRIHQLAGHCNINLVNDALRYWQTALGETCSTEFNAVSESL